MTRPASLAVRTTFGRQDSAAATPPPSSNKLQHAGVQVIASKLNARAPPYRRYVRSRQRGHHAGYRQPLDVVIAPQICRQ